MLGALAVLGAGTALKAGSDYFKGKISNYFAEKRSRDQAALEYAYAQRFAENSPSWNVEGLRKAGLNPILAASNGVSTSSWSPSSPTPPSTDGKFSLEDLLVMSEFKNKQKQGDLYDSQIAVNSAQADSLLKQAQAALINAKSNADRTSADVALKTLEKKRYEDGANYDRPEIRDAHRTLNHALDSFSSTWDYLNDSFRGPFINTKGSPSFNSLINYVKHGPKSSDTDRKVYDKFESLLDDLSNALPFRGLRRDLKGVSNRVRSIIHQR